MITGISTVRVRLLAWYIADRLLAFVAQYYLVEFDFFMIAICAHSEEDRVLFSKIDFGLQYNGTCLSCWPLNYVGVFGELAYAAKTVVESVEKVIFDSHGHIYGSDRC